MQGAGAVRALLYASCICMRAIGLRGKEIPTYAHKDSGGAIEMVGKDHIYDNFDMLVNKIKKENIKQNNTIFKVKDWKTCIAEYYDVINKELF